MQCNSSIPVFTKWIGSKNCHSRIHTFIAVMLDSGYAVIPIPAFLVQPVKVWTLNTTKNSGFSGSGFRTSDVRLPQLDKAMHRKNLCLQFPGWHWFQFPNIIILLIGWTYRIFKILVWISDSGSDSDSRRNSLILQHNLILLILIPIPAKIWAIQGSILIPESESSITCLLPIHIVIICPYLSHVPSNT